MFSSLHYSESEHTPPHESEGQLHFNLDLSETIHLKVIYEYLFIYDIHFDF